MADPTPFLGTVALSSSDPFANANKPPVAPVVLAQVTVGGAGGTTPTAFGAQVLSGGIYVQALSTNTVSVWIGLSDLTVSKGFELLPGAVSPLIPCTQLSGLFHVSTATGQKVNLLGY